MSPTQKLLGPKIRLFLVLSMGGVVVALFGLTLSDFLSARQRLEMVQHYSDAIVLARQTDADFQLAISKGKNFAILKDEKNKRLMRDYFQKAQAAFGQLEKIEQDPGSQELLYRLGASLRAVEFPLGILASTAKKTDPAEKLYSRYLKDITIAFDNNSQAYVDHLEERITRTRKDSNFHTRTDLLLALAGALLAMAGMAFSFSIANNLAIALRKEEELDERYRNLIEVTEEAIMIHDQGVILEVNPTLCRLLGYELPELLGQHVSKFQDRAATEKLAQYLHRGYPEGSYEVVAVRKDGTNFPLLVHGRDIEINGKKLRVSSGWDLTEWKRAERSVAESRERFERFAEVAKEGILIHENGIVMDMNPTLENMTGWSRAELVGTDGMKVLSTESRELIQGFRKTGYPKDPYEIGLRKKNGSIIPVEVHGREFTFGGKRLRVASMWDLRERKKVEEELKISEEKFRSFVENSYDIFHMMGLDTTVFYISPSVRRVLGYEVDELAGRRFVEWVHPEDSDRVRELLTELLGSKGKTVRAEMRFRHKDGSYRVLESTLVNLLENPSVRGVVANSRDVTEHKMAEGALRHSEENFRNLIENSHDIISIAGEDRAIKYMSPSVKKILSHEPAQLIGQTFAAIMHPDDIERLRGEFRNLLANPGVPVTVQFRLKHKDGTWRQCESVGINLLTNPAVQGMVYNIRDVTEKMKAEDALRQSEERFRTLIEKSNDVIALIGRDGSTLYNSPSIQQILGYSPAERLGRPFYDIVFPDDLPKMMEYFHYILEHPGETVTAKARVLHKEGMWRELEGAATNHLDNPDVNGIILNFRDITERVVAEEESKENQERYRSLVESMPDAVLVHDEKKIIYANASAVRILKAADTREITGMPFLDVIPPEFQEAVLGRIRRVMNEGASNDPAERRIRRLDGSFVEALVTSVPFQDRGHRVVLAILSDISARKEAERKAHRFQRLAALGEMAAGMAHEIRNPTAAISVQAQYLMRKMAEGDPTYEALKDIVHQCERLETLVRDTLDYSPEKKFEERTVVTPKALLERALWLAQTQFGPSHARTKVVLDAPEDLPLISVHPTRMERVLVNLIMNAFQAMPEEGGHLLLKAGMDGNSHVLRVQDDGKGMSDDEMARLFEPFYTSRKMGSGLGLAICQKIVGEHQGQIRAERVTPHGAAFTIEIPVGSEEKAV